MLSTTTVSLVVLLLLALVLTSPVDAAATGRVILNKSLSKKKLTFVFMVKSFFGTLIDPTFSGEIKVSKPSAKGKSVGGKAGGKHKLGSAAGVFGEGGAAIGGGSFGPVCGPNGCT